MKRIAILLTVHNRIDKTIKCLTSLFNSGYESYSLSLDIYLTDDGSTVTTQHPYRKLLVNKA